MKIFTILLLLCLGAGILAAPQGDYEDYDYGGGDEETILPEEEEETTIVEKNPIVFEQKSQKISVIEGDSVSMSCKTVSPTLEVPLFKQTDIEPEILLYAGALSLFKANFTEKDLVYSLTNARRENSGIYTCLYQPNYKIEYEIDVQYPPSIKPMKHSKKRVKKGEDVSLSCKVDGNPKPTITWTRESGHLPSGEKKMVGEKIIFEDVDRHVEGTYVCTAKNGIGEPATSAVKFHVEYPPEIITEKEIIRTGEGDKVELECIIHARPKAAIKWYKDDMEIGDKTPKFHIMDSGHKHTLIISDVTEMEYGTYSCLASNHVGNETAKINLTDLPQKPKFTSLPNSSKDNEYTLTWDTESFYPITEYTLKYRLMASNASDESSWEKGSYETGNEDNMIEKNALVHKMKHTISGLKAATEYEAVVKVKNKRQWGDDSAFRFSTRRESAERSTTGGSSAVTWSLSLLIISRIASMIS